MFFITQTNWVYKGAMKIGFVTPPMVKFVTRMADTISLDLRDRAIRFFMLLQKWILGRSHSSVMSIRPCGQKSKQVSAYPLNNINSWRTTIWWHFCCASLCCGYILYLLNASHQFIHIPQITGTSYYPCVLSSGYLDSVDVLGWVNHHSIYSNTKIEMKRMCA